MTDAYSTSVEYRSNRDKDAGSSTGYGMQYAWHNNREQRYDGISWDLRFLRQL
jgi:hypothetical protein